MQSFDATIELSNAIDQTRYLVAHLQTIRNSREIGLAITKLQEAEHWLKAASVNVTDDKAT